jgi:hypothetical protein
MRTVILFLGIFVLTGIVACSSMRVSVDYDQEVSFARYKVFKRREP